MKRTQTQPDSLFPKKRGPGTVPPSSALVPQPTHTSDLLALRLPPSPGYFVQLKPCFLISDGIHAKDVPTCSPHMDGARTGDCRGGLQLHVNSQASTLLSGGNYYFMVFWPISLTSLPPSTTPYCSCPTQFDRHALMWQLFLFHTKLHLFQSSHIYC